MKTCSRCREAKDLKFFSKNKARPDGYMAACKACMKIYRDDYYEKNSEKVKQDVMARRKELRQKATDFKANKGCTDCGLKDPRVLDFDHLKDKKFNVFDMVDRGLSWEKILKEIEKCEVVCSNCHRIRTDERRKK